MCMADMRVVIDCARENDKIEKENMCRCQDVLQYNIYCQKFVFF